jgi:preprotein translocase subunit SecB
MSSFSPLQLSQAFFTEVSIKTDNDLKLGESQLQTRVEFNGKVHQQDPRNWMVTVRVLFEPEKGKSMPYSGTVECLGVFIVHPNWPEDQVEKLVLVNGTGMLYTMIREMICNITARGPYEMLILPTQSFAESYEQGKKAALARM